MDAVSSVGQQVMGKDQFLKLFTAQARMQNPMSPLETTDFLAQLAQFSSVEQMTNLNTNFEKMLAIQQTLHAAELVGKTVTYQNAQTETPSEGKVTGVRLTAAGPVLMLDNRQVNLDQVTGIYQDQVTGIYQD